MKIITFEAMEPGAGCPNFMAYILTGGVILPVRFAGKTVEQARTDAQTHWDEAMAKQAKLGVKTKPRPLSPAPPIDEEEEAV